MSKDRVDKLSWDSFEDKKLVMCCLVKASDISNEIRPKHISIKWAEKVMVEFYLQVYCRRAIDIQQISMH
jgi:hypothetical protein